MKTQSAKVDRALRWLARHPTATVSGVARKYGCARSTITRARKRSANRETPP